MKTDISLLAITIAAVIYACGGLIVLMYIAHSLAMAAMQARWIVEEIEMVF
jgi:hypothetical protein